MANYKVLPTKCSQIPKVSLSGPDSIQQSNSSHTVVSMSGVPAVVLLPAGNHVKLVNPVFLTVHVSLFLPVHILSAQCSSVASQLMPGWAGGELCAVFTLQTDS